MLTYWRESMSDALDLVKAQAADEHPRPPRGGPRVQLLQGPAGRRGGNRGARNKEPDSFIQYTLDEALKTLEQFQK